MTASGSCAGAEDRSPRSRRRGPVARPGGRGPDRLFTDKRTGNLVDAGLFGLEVDHRDNPPASRPRWVDAASRFGLVMTGSSDYHGAGKPNQLGENTTSPEAYEAIVAHATGTKPFQG